MPTLGQLIERFLAEYSRPRIKDVERYRVQARVALMRAVPQLGSKRADTITAIDVGRLRDVLSRRYAANSVRQTIATLGTAYAWGNRMGVVAGNPCRGIELPQRVDALDYLTADEVKALLSCATERATSGGIADRLQHARLVVAIHTGLRKGELCGLRWRDLDLRSQRLTIARSYRAAPKSGKPRHISLPGVAIPVLAEWVKVCPRTDEGLVFPVRRRDGSWAMSEETSDLLGLPALLTAAGVRVPSHCWLCSRTHRRIEGPQTWHQQRRQRRWPSTDRTGYLAAWWFAPKDAALYLRCGCEPSCNPQAKKEGRLWPMSGLDLACSV